LVQRLAGPITGFAARLLGDRTEAEDVAQESFTRLWRAYDLSPPKDSVRAWLYRTAHNLCIDRLRKRARTTAMPDGHDPVDPTANAETKAIERDEHKALQAALNALPPRQHSAILLVHYQGLSGREAAGVMEIGEEALESLLARGRRSLRAALTPPHMSGKGRAS
jgi:RNA polymerase sigma-70 factor (ECF subfamily)